MADQKTGANPHTFPEPTFNQLGEKARHAIRTRAPLVTTYLRIYKTRGGSLILASHEDWNDDGRPRDLVIVTALGEVIKLSPTANPRLVQEVRMIVEEGY